VLRLDELDEAEALAFEDLSLAPAIRRSASRRPDPLARRTDPEACARATSFTTSSRLMPP